MVPPGTCLLTVFSNYTISLLPRIPLRKKICMDESEKKDWILNIDQSDINYCYDIISSYMSVKNYDYINKEHIYIIAFDNQHRASYY